MWTRSEERERRLRGPRQRSLAQKKRHRRSGERVRSSCLHDAAIPLTNDNLISQAAVTMVGAEQRQESCGSHAREDFPERDDKTWMKHTLSWADDAKRAVAIDFRPVHTYTMTNEIKYIPPNARTY